MPDGSFCHNIIPRNTVVFNKGKEALSISLKTTLIFNGQVGMVGSVCNHPFVELIYLLAKLLEVPFLESILLNSFENGNNQVLDLQNEGFKFTVGRGLPEILVQIANQVDKAFLLSTLYGIIARVKVRDQYALVARQKIMHNRRLACFRHPEDHMGSVGEDPYVMINTLDVDGCLINVNKRTCQNALNKQALCICIVMGKVIKKIDDVSSTDMHMKQIFRRLCNESIRQAKHQSLVHDPGLQSTTI